MNSIRLLVMDDDAAVAEVAASMAEAQGGQGRVVTRMRELVEAVENWAPTHIAVDLVMPGIDGIEIMNLLAQRRCRARIIVCSGMDETVLDAAMRAAVANGLDVAGVLAKPFSMRELRALLESPSVPAAPGLTPKAGSSAEIATPVLTEADLRRALQIGDIFPIFMPIVDCITGELRGVEANARWRHQAGVLTADQFIPLAERLALIDDLTESIARQALAWLGRFAGPPPNLTLKLSAVSLSSFWLVETLAKLCVTQGVDPRRVTLQLSESAAMGDTVGALELLTRLRMRGFELSLGNFGAGYSSLMYLVRLPVSELKIDPALSHKAAASRERRAVCKCVVDLGISLGVRVTASGIESAEDLRYFSEIGAHYAMGFFIAHPMAAGEFDGWIARWRNSQSSRWEDLLRQTANAGY